MATSIRTIISFASLAFLLPGVTPGQSYPAKPIRINTAGTGGSPDFMARLVAAELSALLGQAVVVENIPTANLLASGVAKAAPDGYTLMVSGSNLWIAPLFAEVPYNVVRDFAPIATLARAPTILVVHPSLPVKSVADLVKLVKVRSGELNYSSGSNGSSSHLAGELFKSLANVNIVRIAYKSNVQETTDLLSGQVQMTINASVSSFVQAGKLRALAIGGSQRSLLFPDLPTVAETLPGFVGEALVPFWAPEKTPHAIVRRLNQEAVRALDKPEVRERMLKIGLEPVGGAPEILAVSVKSEVARVSKLIKDGGIKSGGE